MTITEETGKLLIQRLDEVLSVIKPKPKKVKKNRADMLDEIRAKVDAKDLKRALKQ
jgi:hypothetical protein